MLQSLSDFISKVTRGETLDIDGQKARWQKVSELTPGLMIAVPEDNFKIQNSKFKIKNTESDILWDEIVSIRRLGAEQVYDIEVEGTHNFVANRIFAHNTVGKALLTLNETGDQNIMTASASGTTQFSVSRTGVITAEKFVDTTSSPTYYLDPAGSTSLYAAGDVTLESGGTIQSTGNGAITINAGSGLISLYSSGSTAVCVGSDANCTGKLDAGTIDPPYTINGKKYATYLQGMTGIKEETTGTIYTSTFIPTKGGYRAIIDFTNSTEGSDLWLFGKITALKKHIDQMTVLLSAASNARSWYEVDPQTLRLSIFTSKPSLVSYRLSAPRFDSDQWKNTRDSDPLGFVINDADGPPPAIDDQGYVAGVSLTLVKKDDGNGAPFWQLMDTAGLALDEVLTASQGTIANLTAGSIDVGELTIGGKPLKEYIREMIQSELLISPITTDVISPLSDEPGDGITVELGEDQRFVIASKVKQSLEIATGSASPRDDVLLDVQGSATISGTLYADRIVTRFGEIANLQTSTIAATYITNNITNVSQATSSAIETAELLDLIARVRDGLATSPAPQPDATSSALLVLIDQPVTMTSSLSVADQILVSGPLLVGNDGIHTTSDTLYIEKGKTANLDIMAGTIVVNTAGDVIITGNLAVSGNVAIGGVLGVNRISPSEGELTIDLTRWGGTGTESGELVSRFGLLIFEHEGREVAAITASGAGVFRKLFIDEASASGSLATPSAGLATLPAGATDVTIVNAHVTQNSLIYVTPVSSTANQVLYIKKKEEGVSFTVALDQPSTADITFNWWIIN